MITNKYCALCKCEKPVESFYKNSKSAGYSVYCKPCQSKYNHLNRDKSKNKDYNKKWRSNRLKSDPEYPKFQYGKYIDKLRLNPAKLKAIRFFNNSHGRNRKDINSAITVEYLTSLFENSKFCSCCGIELTIDPPKIKSSKQSNTSSVDRIDNTKEYTIDNIAIICLKCNTLKRDMSIQNLQMIINYIKKYINV